MNYVDIHLFGNVNYFKYIINNDIKILPNNYIQKGWYFNKFTIAGANGIINLSIPISGGRNQKLRIKEVQIANENNWQQQHLKSIASSYGNAPFFDYYYPLIQTVYSKQKKYLLDFDLEISNLITSLMKTPVEFVASEEVIHPRKVYFTKQFVAENPDLVDFKIHYPQVFESKLGFIPNLSIIDLLMCMGPASKSLLVL